LGQECVKLDRLKFMKRYLGTTFTLLLVLVILGATFWSGWQLGERRGPAIERVSGLSDLETLKPDTVDFSPFWEAWTLLDEKYVNSNGTSTIETKTEDRLWGAISGMTAALGDPYTVFLPPTEKRQFEEDISGNFSGVGMEIGVKDGILTVVAPLPNTPAKRAGIQAGDKILSIDGELTSEMSVDEAVSNIRGERGTVVKLTILRVAAGSEPQDIQVKRDIIEIPTIETELLPEQVFVIRLYNFSANSPDLFRQALLKFQATGTDRLVLDLRGNPGGYLDAAVDMASWFLPEGKVVVWEHRGEGAKDVAYRSKGYNAFTDDLKMIVLVDRGSASASEILAGALSEYDIATLVGEQTFGKGSVQELVPVTRETALKVTIARWLTPKGVSISKEGLTPAVVVELSAEDYEAGRDHQLDKAVQLLLGQ